MLFREIGEFGTQGYDFPGPLGRARAMSRPRSASGSRRRIVIIQQQLAVLADVFLKLLANLREGTADFAPPATLLAQVLPCRLSARVCLG